MLPMDAKGYALWRLGGWELLARRRGRTIVYVQGPHELLCRVRDCRATADFLGATLEAVPARGFDCPSDPTARRFDFRASWDAVTYEPELLSVAALDARIVWDGALVREIRDRAGRRGWREAPGWVRRLLRTRAGPETHCEVA